MPVITYDNPAAEIQDIRIAAVSGDPLRHGATYDVVEDVAAVLLRRPEWSAAAGDAIADDDAPEAEESTPPAPATAAWQDVKGIGPAAAQALALGLDITSREQLQNEIAAYGTDRIIQIPGIGDAITARLVEFAKE